MRKVLVAIDGSENAQRALDYAASLAAPAQPLMIYLLYVYEDIPDGVRTHAFHSNEALSRPERDHGQSVLEREAARIAASGAEVVNELLTGDVARTIVERAEAHGCGSIVLGRKGDSLLADMLLGSTTMTVLQETKLPVTLVK